MLNGFTQSQWIQDEWTAKQLSQATSPTNLIVNKRGDSILHFAAMCGRLDLLMALVEIYKVDVNIQNPLGETPTLIACRSGHGRIVSQCLNKYSADASLAANNGETPLHWLCQFNDGCTELLAANLIKRGGKIEAVTTERVMHSYFPGSIDTALTFGSPSKSTTHCECPLETRRKPQLRCPRSHAAAFYVGSILAQSRVPSSHDSASGRE